MTVLPEVPLSIPLTDAAREALDDYVLDLRTSIVREAQKPYMTVPTSDCQVTVEDIKEALDMRGGLIPGAFSTRMRASLLLVATSGAVTGALAAGGTSLITALTAEGGGGLKVVAAGSILATCAIIATAFSLRIALTSSSRKSGGEDNSTEDGRDSSSRRNVAWRLLRYLPSPRPRKIPVEERLVLAVSQLETAARRFVSDKYGESRAARLVDVLWYLRRAAVWNESDVEAFRKVMKARNSIVHIERYSFDLNIEKHFRAIQDLGSKLQSRGADQF